MSVGNASGFNELKILRRGDNMSVLLLPRIVRILTTYGSSCKSAALEGSSFS